MRQWWWCPVCGSQQRRMNGWWRWLVGAVAVSFFVGVFFGLVVSLATDLFQEFMCGW